MRLGIDAPKDVEIHRHPETHFCHDESLIFFPTTRSDVKLGACLACRKVYLVTNEVQKEIPNATYDVLYRLWQVDPAELDREIIKSTISPDPAFPGRMWDELPKVIREALEQFR